MNLTKITRKVKCESIGESQERGKIILRRQKLETFTRVTKSRIDKGLINKGHKHGSQWKWPREIC